MPEDKALTFKDVFFSAGSYKNKLFKIIDFSFGGLLCLLIKSKNIERPKLDKGKISRILIIRPGGIGDAVLVIPLIIALNDTFKNVRIDILAEKRNAGVFSLVKEKIGEIFCYDNLLKWPFLCRKLKKENYDIIFDTEQWHNLTAIVSYRIGKKRRVGFDARINSSKLYTDLAPYSQHKYEADNFLQMPKALMPGEAINQAQPPFISLSPELILWAKGALGEGKVAAISLSASIKEKFWGVDNSKEIANYLIGKGYKVAFLGGRREKEGLRGIFDGISKKEYALDFVGKTTLVQTAALIKQSHFLLSPDSGILHLAFALGIPTISLFGPGIKDKWAPQGKKNIVISKDLECSPCTLFGYTYPCKHVACMKEIKPSDVITAIERIEGAI